MTLAGPRRHEQRAAASGPCSPRGVHPQCGFDSLLQPSLTRPTELRLGKPAVTRRLSRQSHARTVAARSVATADLQASCHAKAVPSRNP